MQVQFSNLKFQIVIFLSLFTFYLQCTPNIFAQTAQNTITVVPQITRLDLSEDEPEALIMYKNSSSQTVELALSIEDVAELEERDPVNILAPKDAANYKYGLSSWAFLDRQTLLLNPGEERSIRVSIAEDKLSPGGHYGTVLAEITQTNNKEKIKLKGILASLLFVRAATGNEIEEAKLSTFDRNDSGIRFPESFIMRFQNTGNVDLTPYGLIEIKDAGGNLVARGIINQDSLSTLPEAIRLYDIPVEKLKRVILPGKYTAVLSLHYGKQKKMISHSMEFVTQGSVDAVKSAAGIIVASAALYFISKRLRAEKLRRTTGQT